jgi:hypothetical protein
MQTYPITTIDPDNTAYVASITTSSQASTAIATGSGMIRISTQGNHVHLAFGSAPTASLTTSFFIGSSAAGSISIIAVD